MESLNALGRQACRRIRQGDLLGAHRAVLKLALEAKRWRGEHTAALALQLQSVLSLLRQALDNAAFNVPEVVGNELASLLSGEPTSAAVADEFEARFHGLLNAACDRASRWPLADRIKLYIDANFHRPGTIKMIAAALGCSPASVTSAFKAREGISAAQYLLDLRLNRAEFLVRTKRSMAMDEVARRSGFQRYETLRRHFKDRFGVPPGGYRKRFRS